MEKWLEIVRGGNQEEDEEEEEEREEESMQRGGLEIDFSQIACC